jgi:hypothetical protein
LVEWHPAEECGEGQGDADRDQQGLGWLEHSEIPNPTKTLRPLQSSFPEGQDGRVCFFPDLPVFFQPDVCPAGISGSGLSQERPGR